ncbi:response regulator transcription factor [Rhodobacteraceae bacterium N5(2021)]|uniref:Response regulator transcription factor n=1 Tax=Gymnodinialimonas phycosphaerae TaxID=2841589 RepID=A0A975TTN8_9RHOB|nr:response regulator transcription factor [Gymnodinialimonas phycosphaerae]MBY4893889.1 response regulator transcription factor [Gymnodinialimonas phycosphaerae]
MKWSGSLGRFPIRSGQLDPRSDAGLAEAFDDDLQTSILLADDHLLLAEAVAAALSSKPREFRTRISATLDEALAELGAGHSFDLVLLDVKMPGMLGLKSVERVIAAAEPAQVVLISGQVDRAFVQSAVEKGARGLIPKTLPLRSLASAIDLVLSGQIFLPATAYGEPWNSADASSAGLSDRELNIVRLLAIGSTNKEIANEFADTETTVKMQMRAICRKLNARNRAHVVLIAKENNLI